VHQTKYVKELLRKFGLDKAKAICTSMLPSISLNLKKESKSVDITKYRQMIGSLPYIIASIPDLMFSIYMYARF